MQNFDKSLKFMNFILNFKIRLLIIVVDGL